MKESDIQKSCLEYLAARGIFAWRNQSTGIWDQKRGIFRRLNSIKGVSDILGILEQEVQVTIDGELSVERFGCLLAVEVKMEGKHPSEDQKRYLEEVNKRGGVGICVHSVDELAAELDRFL